MQMLLAKIFTCCFFFLVCWTGGFALTSFWKGHGYRQTVMRIGVGLALLPFVGMVFNTLEVPIHWLAVAVFLGISSFLISLLCRSFSSNAPPAGEEEFDHSRKIALALVVLATVVYISGAFSYPWLENDDSWSHAAAVKYITIEKNLDVPPGEFQYIMPYPPGYDIILALLHQVVPSVYWVLKFFNALIVGLSYLFFYEFARIFLRDPRKALWALFFLVCIPCYLSHFIWAHSLILALWFPALFFLIKSEEDNRFIFPAAAAIAGIFLTQPTQSIKFVIFALLMAVSFLITREASRGKRIVISLGLGGVISLAWWSNVFYRIFNGTLTLNMRSAAQDLSSPGKAGNFLQRLFDPTEGTATREYFLHDFLIAPFYNMINNPTGIGIALCFLALAGIFIAARNIRQNQARMPMICTLLWLGFTFLGVNSMTFRLPVGLVAFRFWMLLAIPVCLLAAEAIHAIENFFTDRARRARVLAVIIIAVVVTSGFFKFRVNTAIWPWGVYWNGYDEIMGYTWMRKSLPPNSRVFAFTDNIFVIGHDMRADYWREDYKKDFRGAFGLESGELYARLLRHGFQYIVVGQREVRTFGLEEVNRKIQVLDDDPRFEPVFDKGNGARIYRIR